MAINTDNESKNDEHAHACQKQSTDNRRTLLQNKAVVDWHSGSALGADVDNDARVATGCKSACQRA